MGKPVAVINRLTFTIINNKTVWGDWGVKECEQEEFIGDYCWDSGALKMYNLRTNKLVPDEEQIEVNKEKTSSEKFNEKNEQTCIDEAKRVFMDKLPKFPKAMLERMRAEEDKRVVSVASNKFYTWKVGAKASSTSHTAWGHRRSGGGKSSVANGIIFNKMNSDTALLERATAKRIRRITTKEKKEVENVRYAEIMKRVISQQPVVEEVEVTEPIVESSSSISQLVISKLVAKVEHHDYEVKQIFIPKSFGSEWTKVNKSQNKKDKISLDLTIALYQTPKTEVEKAVEKKPMSKKVTATLMCSSVAKNEKCPHPEGKCNFAHCAEELKPRVCANKCCKFVRQMGGKFINRGFKVCAYIHEGETKTNLCNRIGLRVKSVPVVVVLETITYTTPVSKRVLKPFSNTQVWAPIDYVKPVKKSRWGAKK